MVVMEKGLVLVVDDEPSIIRLLANSVEAASLRCISAGDGEEGFQKFSQYHPSILVIDFKMPKKNGPTLAREVRSTDEGRQVYIIGFTGYDCQLDEAAARCFNVILHKPKGIQQIPSALLEAIQRQGAYVP